MNISRFVYGTTRLGDGSLAFADRVAVARQAIEAGAWIHTSHQYGDALRVLKAAFDEDRDRVPPAIFKIGWSSVDEVRGQVEEQLDALQIPQMAIGQLCPGGPLADDLRSGGPSRAGLQRMREEGIVCRYVMEVWPWTSDVALDVIRGGHDVGLIEGLIFYLNPLQRFVTNELWDLVQERGVPVIAMRTVSGGDVRTLAENAHAPDYLRARAAELLPIFRRSGIQSWTEFAARFSLGLPGVRATVGSTARPENLDEFLRVTADPAPLPDDVTNEILALQRRWSDEHDRHAAPWSM